MCSRKDFKLKNISFVLFFVLVVALFLLLSLDYFGLYRTPNNFEDNPSYAVFSQDNRPNIVTKFGSNLSSSPEKYLILHQGGLGWRPMLAENLIKNYKYIEELPFDGFTTLGNSYTDRVMKKGENVTYNQVWREVNGLKDLYQKKTENFMIVNIHFPGDFWDDVAWEQTAKNFSIVAKVAKDLGFKGIAFDDEPYTKDAIKMTNFRFPKKSEVKRYPNRYAEWERKGAQPNWVDYGEKGHAYRNEDYNFSQHMSKVTDRFQRVMELMVKEYPDITVLVYFGSMFSHPKTDWKDLLTSSTAGVRTHEYKGAMFTGFKKGLGKHSSLHDMAERYAYRKPKHFQDSYRWRKYEMAKDKNNDTLDKSWQWSIPKKERRDWSKVVNVGFMSFNKGLKNPYNFEYDTRDKSTLKDIESATKNALKYSDKYVVYFSLEQNWLTPDDKRFPIEKKWRESLKRVYESY